MSLRLRSYSLVCVLVIFLQECQSLNKRHGIRAYMPVDKVFFQRLLLNEHNFMKSKTVDSNAADMQFAIRFLKEYH